jgi:hypothetical protein
MFIHKKLLAGFLICIAIAFFSCKQIAYKATPPGSAGSFLPETYGSTWSYRDSLFSEVTDSAQVYGPIVDTVQYTMNGQTTDFNSQICYNVQGYSKLKGAFTAYFYNYRHLCQIWKPTLLYGLTIFDLLIDNEQVGYQWRRSPSIYGTINGFPALSINTILALDSTMSVEGRVYTNVCHTGVNLQVNKGDGFHNIASYDIYTAPGVGLIELDSHVYNSYNERQLLLNYAVSAQ